MKWLSTLVLGYCLVTSLNAGAAAGSTGFMLFRCARTQETSVVEPVFKSYFEVTYALVGASGLSAFSVGNGKSDGLDRWFDLWGDRNELVYDQDFSDSSGNAIDQNQGDQTLVSLQTESSELRVGTNRRHSDKIYVESTKKDFIDLLTGQVSSIVVKFTDVRASYRFEATPGGNGSGEYVLYKRALLEQVNLSCQVQYSPQP